MTELWEFRDMEIDSQLEKRCDELVSQYPKRRSAAMMVMHAIQEKFGYFDDSAVEFAARKLGVEPIEVYGMLSFYPMYSDTPRGRIHIKVCRTLSCALSGSVKLGQELAKITGCRVGDTKGVYTLEFVECLGNCVRGPNVQVNDKLFEAVAPEDAEKFMEKISALDAAGELAPRSSFDNPQGDGFDSPAYKG